MITTETNINTSTSVLVKFKTYTELLKPRLSFLVAFSAAFGYLLAFEGTINWATFISLSMGGFLVSGASIMINQIIEKDLDRMMDRTQNRPIPSGRVTVNEAIFYTIITGIGGLFLLLSYTNILTTALAFVSMLLYGFVYTPLKRVGSIAVFVGAIPGALPPMLGWVAATGRISYEAIIIFAFQFIWQFPHFWAIAWVLDDDYKKAGFKLLPSKKGKDVSTAFQIAVYTMFLIPMGLLPTQVGITGLTAGVIATGCGILFLVPALQLLKICSSKGDAELAKQQAKRIMFGSFIYLPVVQIAFLIDKI
ncbi:heme o synthase [Microscilla marina]|uniref:Protoheme IX farnesyltransferase n=1 Tax=Microscilla marina ATCC 23134 TaxID=313606 RepID=A1ZL79_MICM2|nr:heme o synthase [Microscilla marina]EAY29045.1 protoheme IX farnesyltransferase [Microscilla marina ATCC 23134]